jgi:hypothetical protein
MYTEGQGSGSLGAGDRMASEVKELVVLSSPGSCVCREMSGGQ